MKAFIAALLVSRSRRQVESESSHRKLTGVDAVVVVGIEDDLVLP
jgi:hypothetical protein